MNGGIQLKIVSALEKVFPDVAPVSYPADIPLTALRGETVSFQLAYRYDGGAHSRIEYARLSIDCPRAEKVRIREVTSVPCRYPAHVDLDDGYLRTEPGLYPDLLLDTDGSRVRLVPGQWKAIWVDFEAAADEAPGDVPIHLTMSDLSGTMPVDAMFTVQVLRAALPEQTLVRTEWFHTDCLANYYDVEVFSERHWEIIENFIRAAAKRGITMILTPQFTPPLDTAVGGSRTTVQLVDVYREDGVYRYGFDKLDRWINICNDCGIRYIEMSHLFTQWGAKFAPKIMGNVLGQETRLFGWDTPAVGGDYEAFLDDYLPALAERLRALGVADRTYFHISDEPGREQLEDYRAAKAIVTRNLPGFKIVDAVSDIAFYEPGSQVICATDHIEPFLSAGVQGLWSYYCTGQWNRVSNRFFSMPSARARIYGVQLFKFDIVGALHWGYNFYNTHLSLSPIDPYFVTDAGEAFPGGDPFLVYPREDGGVNESIRMMLMDQAMCDLRAMNLLKGKKGKAHVIALIDSELWAPVTFSQYPRDAEYLLKLRHQVNLELDQLSSE